MAYPQDIAIVNPGAESAIGAEWTQVKGSSFRRTATPTSANAASGTARSGSWVYNWGSAQRGIVEQTVDISGWSSGDLADIDNGLIFADYEAWLSCEPDGTDYGMCAIRFTDASDNYLGGWQSNTYNHDNWTNIGRSDLLVPQGTRKVVIQLAGTRSGGDAYVDVSFDDLKVTFKYHPSGHAHKTLAKFLPVAGGTDHNSWTSSRTDETTAAISSADGSGDHWGYYPGYKACTTTHATVTSYTDIAIPSGWHTAVDAGDTAFCWNHKQHVDGGLATMRTYWDYLDGSNVVIGSRNYSDVSEVTPTKLSTISDVWNYQAIPANTRKIRFGTEQSRLGGISCFAWLYYMQFNIVNEAPSPPAPPTVMARSITLENAITANDASLAARYVALENAISDETARFSARSVVLEVARSLKPRKAPIVSFTLGNSNS